METGFGKGGKGSEANGSPARMEQGKISESTSGSTLLFRTLLVSCLTGRIQWLAILSFKVKVFGPQTVGNGFQLYDGSTHSFPQTSPFGKGGFAPSFQQSAVGGCVGGCTPQVQQMNQLLSLSLGLSSVQSEKWLGTSPVPNHRVMLT